MTMMSQLGFFDIANRYAGLDAKKTLLLNLTPLFRGKTFVPVWRLPGASHPRFANHRQVANPWIL